MADLVSDSYGPITNPQAFLEAGYVGCMRYLSPTPAKNLTLNEARKCWDVGLLVGLNYESTANFLLGGGEAGVRAGQLANSQANALGFPNTIPIYYSADTDVSPKSFYIIGAALDAAGGRPRGIYGGADLVDWCINNGHADYGWVANAHSWSHGHTSVHAHLEQQLQQSTIGNTTVDVNHVLRPDWGGYNPNISTPASPEEDVPKSVIARNPATNEVALFNEAEPFERVHLKTKADIDAYLFIGVPSAGDIEAWFNTTEKKTNVGP